MVISKGQVITLENDKQYLIISGKKVGKRDFCIAATVKDPIEFILLEMRQDKKGNAEAKPYEGEDYADILQVFLKNE